MAYTADSPICGQGTIAAEAIDAYFITLGRQMAPAYAPDKQYLAPPPGLGAAIIASSQRWTPATNSDLVAGQALHESAAWQSYWARIHNNPAGIGVTGQAGVGEHFTTPQAGFDAQVAHLLDYAVGRGTWTSADPRADDMPRSSFGAAPTLKGLNGLWAVPGPAYGQMIARTANDLVAFAATWRPPAMSTVPKPPMTIRHSPRFDGYNHPREYRAIVDHIATGSKASNLSWLAGGSADDARPSCNYYVAKDGTIYEIVPYAHAPWTNGVDFSKGIAAYKPNLKNPVVRYWFDNKINPNTGSVTTEHEGEASDRLTGAQLASDGWLKAWIHQETGIPLDADHWFGHNFIDSVNRPYCPSFAPEEWDEMRQLALARLAGASVPPATPVLPTPPSELVLPGQPHGIAFTLGFRQHLLKIGNVVNPQDPALGALAVFGYAKTAAYYADDGNAYQPTERYCLVYQPGQLPPWDVVGLFRGADPPPPKRSD